MNRPDPYKNDEMVSRHFEGADTPAGRVLATVAQDIYYQLREAGMSVHYHGSPWWDRIVANPLPYAVLTISREPSYLGNVVYISVNGEMLTYEASHNTIHRNNQYKFQDPGFQQALVIDVLEDWVKAYPFGSRMTRDYIEKLKAQYQLAYQSNI